VPTITDILVTQLKIVGVEQVQTGLTDTSKQFTAFAAATNVGSDALTNLLGPAALAVTAFKLLETGIRSVVGFFNDSVDAFAQSEDAIARVAIRMRNLGNVFPLADLIAFSDKMEALTGIDGELITTLGATAAGFGETRAQIEKNIPAILDIAAATKKGPIEVLNILQRATKGRTQGLFGLDVNPALLKGDLTDINNLIQQIGKSVEGTAEAFRFTLPGSIKAADNALTNMEEAVGRLLSPFKFAFLEGLILELTGITANLNAIADFFHIPTAARLGEGKANPLAVKGDPEQTEYQRQTAENTKKLDTFISQVIGGTGEVAGRSFTWRDAKAAWGV